MRIGGALIYLGIGALCHAMFVGAHFDFANAWTWGWLLGWPIMLFATFMALGLGIAAVVLVAMGIAYVFGWRP